MDTLNVYLHAETQGEAQHCCAFLVNTLGVKVVTVDDLRAEPKGKHWLTLLTSRSVEELGLELKAAGFNAEVFGTEEYV